MICDVEKNDYSKLIEVWEASVRATHDFLPEEEICQLKPLILNKYFDVMLMKCFKNPRHEIVGFFGIANQKIEMLFVSPNAQGQGVGTMLCQHAVEHHHATKVDVNEQNHRAIKFYEKVGFEVIGRSELDSQGKPYPILHMKKN